MSLLLLISVVMIELFYCERNINGSFYYHIYKAMKMKMEIVFCSREMDLDNYLKTGKRLNN